MPALKSERHEIFAQAIADGETNLKAHEMAGYKPNSWNAAALRRYPAVAARIDELFAARKHSLEIASVKATQKAIERLEIDEFWVLNELKGIVIQGRKEGKLAPAVTAAKAIGGHLGMLFERAPSEPGNREQEDPIEYLRALERRLGIVDVEATEVMPETAEATQEAG